MPLRSLLMLLLAFVLLGGSGSGCQIDRIRAENDRLRAENLQLRDELQAEQARIIAIQQQIGRIRAEAGLDQSDPALPDISEVEPVVTNISIGRLSHAEDLTVDGLADLLVVYVHPRDGLGRFVQLAGSATVSATVIDDEGVPATLGRMTLSPSDVRDAYRSSFMGTVYRFDLPISANIGHEAAIVQVSYTDGRSGRRFQADRSIDLTQPRPPG